MPVLLGMMKYTELQFEKRWRSVESLADPNDATYYKECAREVALAVAKAWDSSKTFGEQKDKVYEIAKNIYNAHPCLQKGGVRSAIPGLIITTMDGEKVELLPSKRTFSKDYVKISIVDDNEHAGKIRVQTDYQVAHAIPAECNANIILAVPTNSGISGSLNKIGAAFGKFAENFNNVRGVYMGIVPYSGKLSIPSDRKNSWTTKFPAFKANDAQQLLIGACLYATKGIKGTVLTDQYSWDNGCPIMFRRGAEITDDKYGKNPYYSGILLSKDNPNSIDNKYIQMDLRPCTLSNASLLGMQCGNDCTQFFANPHAMVEPMDDMAAFKTKCNGLTSFNQSGNDSSFIFAALEWANNMLQSWTKDPQKPLNTNGDSSRLGSQSKTTAGRKSYIVLLVNKPDYFKDGEMTYVGFNDDWKEAAKVESETLTFSPSSDTQTLESANKFLTFSGKVTCSTPTDCTLTVVRKRLVILTVEPTSSTEPGTLEFSGLKNASDSKKVQNKAYKIGDKREFFIEKEHIPDNLILKLKATNLKFVSAEITNKGFSSIPAMIRTSKDGDRVTISTNCKNRVINLSMTPKIPHVKFQGTPNKDVDISKQETYEFSGDVTYELMYARIDSAKTLITETKVIETRTETYELDGHGYVYCWPAAGTEKVVFKNEGPKSGGFNQIGIYEYYKGDGKHGQKVDKDPTRYKDFKKSLRKGETYEWRNYPGKCALKTWESSGDIKVSISAYGPVDTPYDAKHDSSGRKIYNKTSDDKAGKKLVVKVSPTLTSPYIKDVRGSGTKIDISGNTASISARQFHFEPRGNEYEVVLDLNSIDTINATLDDDMDIYFKVEPTVNVRTDSGNVVLRKAANNETDGTKAAKTLTAKACSKENLGDNTTVFLVTYGNGDYKYMGSNVQHYDATESNFEAKLNEIAAKIKTSAGYKHARRVK